MLGTLCAALKVLRSIYIVVVVACQGSPNYGPLAGCGPRGLLIRPGETCAYGEIFLFLFFALRMCIWPFTCCLIVDAAPGLKSMEVSVVCCQKAAAFVASFKAKSDATWNIGSCSPPAI